MIAKLILSFSGTLLFILGVALNFLPQETTTMLGLTAAPALTMILQVLSASFLGMGMLNWYSRTNLIGGIYSRPLALANFLLFGVSAVTLDRAVFARAVPLAVVPVAVVATLFAVAFAWLLFLHDPLKTQTSR